MEDILSIFLYSKSIHTYDFALSWNETNLNNVWTAKLPWLKAA